MVVMMILFFYVLVELLVLLVKMDLDLLRFVVDFICNMLIWRLMLYEIGYIYLVNDFIIELICFGNCVILKVEMEMEMDGFGIEECM